MKNPHEIKSQKLGNTIVLANNINLFDFVPSMSFVCWIYSMKMKEEKKAKIRCAYIPVTVTVMKIK